MAAREGGISTFNKPVAGETKWWLIPSGTQLPPELIIRRDHTSNDGRTHYSLAPAFDMPLSQYKESLARLHDACTEANPR